MVNNRVELLENFEKQSEESETDEENSVFKNSYLDLYDDKNDQMVFN